MTTVSFGVVRCLYPELNKMDICCLVFLKKLNPLLILRVAKSIPGTDMISLFGLS